MRIPTELLPVLQITLPIIVTFFIASNIQNRRIDDVRGDMKNLRGDMNRQLDEIKAELKEIRKVLTVQGERIAKLEERIPPLVLR